MVSAADRKWVLSRLTKHDAPPPDEAHQSPPNTSFSRRYNAVDHAFTDMQGLLEAGQEEGFRLVHLVRFPGVMSEYERRKLHPTMHNGRVIKRLSTGQLAGKPRKGEKSISQLQKEGWRWTHPLPNDTTRAQRRPIWQLWILDHSPHG